MHIIPSCLWTSARKMHYWQTGKREKFSEPGLSIWGFIGEFATLSRRFCFSHLPGHMADVLRQIPSDLTAGSKSETLPGAWKRTLSHIEMLPAHRTDVHMHTYCPFFHQLWEGHACNFDTAHWMCWLDEFLKNSWIIRSGCNSSALHPSYSVFIWVACWSQGTAFRFSKKAVQYCLILSCLKLYSLFYESLLASHLLSQRSMSCSATCEIVCCWQRVSNLWTRSGILL